MPHWDEHQKAIADLAQRQLFLVGGAPRSGTTWLQQILNSHPDVCCRGEGLFSQHLLRPMEALMETRRQAIEEKNAGILFDIDGYPVPEPEDTEFLVGTAILLALRRQTGGSNCRAIGEKTPDNVFFFPRLKQLFPRARFIGIARDPRDVLTSAWHFFHQPIPGENDTAQKMEYVRHALPSLAKGARAMLALAEHHPADCIIVTYEALRQTPEPILGHVFRFLGVSDADEFIADCLARASFAALSGGRQPGEERSGSFFRKGVVGDWPSTLTPEMNDLVLRELGWMFPCFGWQA